MTDLLARAEVAEERCRQLELEAANAPRIGRLQWTTEPPTEPGYYLYQWLPGRPPELIEILTRTPPGGRRGKWLGPIHPPEDSDGLP